MIYQLTFIVKAEADTKAVKSVVESVGGKVAHERTVGQRVFTYPIKGLKEGIYFTYHIDIDPTLVEKLDEKLRFEEDIVRFLIVKTEKIIIPAVPQIKVEKPFDLAQGKEVLPAVPEKIEKAIEPAVKKETKPVVAKAEPKKPVKEVKKPAKLSVLEEAKRLKALEEKLEELLKE